MYTFDAIILEKQFIREKHIRIVVLSKEYGRITLWHKKQLTGIDLWDIARIVVSRNNGVNNIKSIAWKIHVIHKKWSYDNLIAFLTILKILKYCTVDSDMYPQIFSDYEGVLKWMWDSISLDCCSLLQMRIFKHLWSLNPDFFAQDSVLQYVYDNISSTPLEKILKSQPLRSDHKTIIERSNLFSFSTFL